MITNETLIFLVSNGKKKYISYKVFYPVYKGLKICLQEKKEKKLAHPHVHCSPFEQRMIYFCCIITFILEKKVKY